MKSKNRLKSLGVLGSFLLLFSRPRLPSQRTLPGKMKHFLLKATNQSQFSTQFCFSLKVQVVQGLEWSVITLQDSGRAFSLLLTLLGKQVLTQPKWRSCGWLMTGLDLAPMTAIPTPSGPKPARSELEEGLPPRPKPPGPGVNSCDQSIRGDQTSRSAWNGTLPQPKIDK